MTKMIQVCSNFHKYCPHILVRMTYPLSTGALSLNMLQHYSYSVISHLPRIVISGEIR